MTVLENLKRVWISCCVY